MTNPNDEDDLTIDFTPAKPIRVEYTLEEWDALSDEEKERVFKEQERRASLPQHLRDL